jgi:hypothetical protein
VSTTLTRSDGVRAIEGEAELLMFDVEGESGPLQGGTP